MAIPSDLTRVNNASGSNDPKLWRPESYANVGLVNQLLAHLRGIEIVDKALAIGQGLENNADIDLRIKLAALSGLIRDANGLGLDLSALTPLTSPAKGDQLVLDDISATAPKRRRITAENFFKVINAFDLLAAADIADDDVVALYDASAGLIKKARRDAISPHSLVLSGETAASSGTQIVVSSGFDDAKHIVFMMKNVSTNGDGRFELVLGDSGGLETSGYVGFTNSLSNTGQSGNVSPGDAMRLINTLSNAAKGFDCVAELWLQDEATNTWMMKSQLFGDDNGQNFSVNRKSLSGPLTQIALQTDAGDTFDGSGVISFQVYT